jgi:hypothetical protein
MIIAIKVLATLSVFGLGLGAYTETDLTPITGWIYSGFIFVGILGIWVH